MIDLILMAVSALVGSLTAFFILRWDKKLTQGLERVDQIAEPYEQIGLDIQATLESPEAVQALVDRAVQVAVLTWKRSDAGEKGGDVRLDKGASKVVRKGIQQVIAESNPLLGMAIEGIMEYASDWVGEDPDGRRTDAVWNQLIKMGAGLTNLDADSLSKPKSETKFY